MFALQLLKTNIFFHLGPALPFQIEKHSMVKMGDDLVVLGGECREFCGFHGIAKSLFR